MKKIIVILVLIHLSFQINKNINEEIMKLFSFSQKDQLGSNLKETHMLQEIQVTKPLQDERKFYLGKLMNNMEVLIINDHEIMKSQIGLSVQVGSMLNPKKIHGIAHLLEHMLLTGSQKYPYHNEFQDCLLEYQGTLNTQTTAKETMFMYDVIDDGFMKCIDIFGNAFISPLLEKQQIHKQVNTIEIEYNNNMNYQNRAQYYALKLLVNKQHPYSKFFTGNYETLINQPFQQDISISMELKNFFNKYYSSNLMKLVIVTATNPFVLYEKIIPIFQQIKDKSVDSQQFQQKKQIFRDFQYIVKYIAKKQIKVLMIIFEIPDKINQYKNKSLNYIFELFKFYGPKSFYKFLKDKNLIFNLDCYVGEQFWENSIVIFEFQLTKQGFKNIDQVVQYFFDFISQISRNDLERDLYESLKQQADIQFKFQVKNKEISQILTSFQFYPVQDVLYHEFNYMKFMPLQILEYMQYMDKDKAQYTLGNNKFEFKKDNLKGDYIQIRSKYVYNKHKDYNIYYQIIQNQFKVIDNQEDHQFQIPAVNKYIPLYVQKVQQQKKQNQPLIIDTPMIIYRNDYMKVWFQRVTQYELPQQIFYLQLYSQISYVNTKQQALNKLFVILINQLIQDNLNEVIQLNNIYQVQVKSMIEGVLLYFKGHYQYTGEIINRLFQLINQMQLDESSFKLIKNKLEVELYNSNRQQAYQQGLHKLQQLLFKQCYFDQQIKKQLNEIQINDIEQYKTEFMKDLIIEGFCTGLIQQNECYKIVQDVYSQLVFTQSGQQIKSRLFKQQVANINNELDLELVVRNSNRHDTANAVLFYLQIGDNNLYQKVIIEMLSHKINQLAVDYLKNQLQIGFVVVAQPYHLDNVFGYILGIQGEMDVDQYKQDLTEFMKYMTNYFVNLELDQFFLIKKAYLNQMNTTFNSLDTHSLYFWSKIHSTSYYFEEKNHILQIVKNLQHENIVDFIQHKFIKGQLQIILKNFYKFDKQDDRNQDGQLNKLISMKNNLFSPMKQYI